MPSNSRQAMVLRHAQISITYWQKLVWVLVYTCGCIVQELHACAVNNVESLQVPSPSVTAAETAQLHNFVSSFPFERNGTHPKASRSAHPLPVNNLSSLQLQLWR